MTIIIIKIPSRHAANFRSFMLLIFWIFHFFSRYLEKEIFLWVCQNIPPHQIRWWKKWYRNFSQIFSRIYDRKDFIILTFFGKYFDYFPIFLIRNISDNSLIFSKFLWNFEKISILRWDIMTDQICKNQKYFLADFRFTNLTILQVICVICANPPQNLSNLANAASNLLQICKCRT